MKSVCTPTRPSQRRTAFAANSGPLSERMCSGTPRATQSSARRASTSCEFSRRATSIARHSRVCSSTIASIRNGRPSAVRSKTKSYDQTWFGRSARRRTIKPSANQSRPRFGCFRGTRSPSSRQSRSTRLWFTRQPSCLSNAVIRR